MCIALWQAEAETSHASLVLLNHWLAVLLWIGGLGEQHALVASGLLLFADAAWL